MSGSNAKPIRVAVIAADGTLLGYVNRKPHNANWRMLGKNPRVTLKKAVGAQECGRMTDGKRDMWAVALHDNEGPPADLEAP